MIYISNVIYTYIIYIKMMGLLNTKKRNKKKSATLKFLSIVMKLELPVLSFLRPLCTGILSIHINIRWCK